MNLWKRFSNWITRVRSALAVTAEVNDTSPGWVPLSGSGLADRDWAGYWQDLVDVLEAWRRNFVIRRIVTITTSYVVGSQGIVISSKLAMVEKFIRRFWDHPENAMRGRLSSWCDEITRTGDLFIAVSAPSEISGMAFVRAIPASSIQFVKSDPDDAERELEFHQTVPGRMEPKIWKSRWTANVDEPAMLHFAFNRVVGATRGESDLTPVLPVAQRYTAWLKGRVQFNQLRNDLAAVDIEVDDDSRVEAKREQYSANPPTAGALFVHGKGERIAFPAANINAGDAAPDGHAQRMAISSGSNYPLHFFGEGSDSNRATAKEMGGPTHSFLEMRQGAFARALIDLVDFAYRRAAEAGHVRIPANGDLVIFSQVADVSEADNAMLAKAAKDIVAAFAEMRRFGWITDELAVGLAFKFFGEILTQEDIDEILDWTGENQVNFDDGTQEEDDDDDDEAQLSGEFSRRKVVTNGRHRY